jgi:hypothetical protein
VAAVIQALVVRGRRRGKNGMAIASFGAPARHTEPRS